MSKTSRPSTSQFKVHSAKSRFDGVAESCELAPPVPCFTDRTTRSHRLQWRLRLVISLKLPNEKGFVVDIRRKAGGIAASRGARARTTKRLTFSSRAEHLGHSDCQAISRIDAIPDERQLTCLGFGPSIFGSSPSPSSSSLETVNLRAAPFGVLFWPSACIAAIPLSCGEVD